MILRELSVAQIAHSLGLSVSGDDTVLVNHVASLGDAGAGALSFLYQPVYLPYLADTSASAVILKQEHATQCPCTAIISPDPYLAYARAAQLLYPRALGTGRRAPDVVIGGDCDIADDVDIGPRVVIGNGVKISSGCVVGACCFIGDACRLGAGTELKPNVTLMTGVRVGERCMIHPGVVVGADGFGFANNLGSWEKIPQTGSVLIGDDVEIGANTTIDRGAIGDTVIEEGVKLDNLIQIGHNVHVGAHTVMAASCAIAGSTVIGKHCMFGGASGVVGHIHIADKVIVTAMSMVTKSIEERGSYSSGVPVEPTSRWRRLVSRLKHLEDLSRRVKELEQKL